MRFPLALVLSLLGLPAFAGDYGLFVQKELGPCQAAGERTVSPSSRVTPGELAEDLLAFFQGKEPRLEALAGVVTNARLTFCGREDRRALEIDLVEIGTQPTLAHERKYIDFVLMLATDHLVSELESRLRRTDLTPVARKRLDYLHTEAPRWMTYRRTGKWPAR